MLISDVQNVDVGGPIEVKGEFGVNDEGAKVEEIKWR